MILERSKSDDFPKESYITIDDKIYDADVVIKYPLLKSDNFSTDKECVVLFFTFVPKIGRKYLFNRYYGSNSFLLSEIQEEKLNGGKPLYGLLFYKGQNFLNNFLKGKSNL